MATVSGGGMDADYLKRTVGDPLSEALTSLAMAQPADPIEFIGEALIDYARRREQEQKRNRHAGEVELRLKKFQEGQIEEKKGRAAVEEAAMARAKVEQDIEAALSSASCHDEVYAKVIGLLKNRLGASGVQLGRKLLVDGREILEYIAASEGREDMIGQELRGQKEGEEAEEGTTEEGVTFDVWKKTELPPPSEPVYDEEGELVADGNEPVLVPPKHILIKNVVREPRVKFFGIPKLGSYLAVPITYDSWLHPGGILIAPADVHPKRREDNHDQDEAEPDAEATPEEEIAEATVEGEGEVTPKALTRLYRMSTFPMQLVLCMDTLGQGRCFRPNEIEWVKGWTAKLIVAVEALEARMFEEDAELLPLLGGNDKVELLSTMSPEAEEAAVDEALAEFAPASEAEKEKVTKTARYRHKIKLVEAMGDLIGVMGRLNLAPSPSAVLTVLEQALVVIGKSKTDLCNARGAMDWTGKMRVAVSAELVPLIVAFDPGNTASAPRALEAKEVVEAIDCESVKDVNLPAWAIVSWMSAAIAATEEAAAAAAAAVEAMAAAAEAAAEAAEAAVEGVGEGGGDEE